MLNTNFLDGAQIRDRAFSQVNVNLLDLSVRLLLCSRILGCSQLCHDLCAPTGLFAF